MRLRWCPYICPSDVVWLSRFAYGVPTVSYDVRWLVYDCPKVSYDCYMGVIRLSYVCPMVWRWVVLCFLWFPNGCVWYPIGSKMLSHCCVFVYVALSFLSGVIRFSHDVPMMCRLCPMCVTCVVRLLYGFRRCPAIWLSYNVIMIAKRLPYNCYIACLWCPNVSHACHIGAYDVLLDSYVYDVWLSFGVPIVSSELFVSCD